MNICGGSKQLKILKLCEFNFTTSGSNMILLFVRGDDMSKAHRYSFRDRGT